MCEISYIKINSLCGDLYITYAQIDNSTFPLRISFIEPITHNFPMKINYASLIPENKIPLFNIEQSINDSISGKYNNFNPVELLKFYQFTQFQYEVYKQLIQIPRGNIISYKQLAAISGYINASRAVGNCMKKNPFLILVPCHRVIKSDATPGGFNGNTHLKISLLAMESIFF